jgi:hypothetical protein
MSRTIRRDNKHKLEKKLISLSRERRKLWDADKALGWIELEEPIRSGWEKSLTLRSDYLKRDDVDKWNKILSYVNDIIVCRNKDFKFRDRRSGKMIEAKVCPKDLTPKEYNSIEENLKRYFYKRTISSGNKYYYSSRDVYTLYDTYMFVEKISRHYITRVKVSDKEIDMRINEINDYLYHNALWGKLDNLYGHKYNYVEPKLMKLKYKYYKDPEEDFKVAV